jgi:hypothetical protein
MKLHLQNIEQHEGIDAALRDQDRRLYRAHKAARSAAQTAAAQSKARYFNTLRAAAGRTQRIR